MGTFNIKSSSINTKYEYESDSAVVTGGFTKDAETKALKSLNGDVYQKDSDGNPSVRIGRFTGEVNEDGSIAYNTPYMTEHQREVLTNAIKDIESNILGKNE